MAWQRAWAAVGLAIAGPALGAEPMNPILWTLAQRDGGWRLLRDGEPFYVRGAVAAAHWEALAAAGANSARCGPRRETLDRLHALGLAAMVNLPVRGERDGFDWDDEAQVAAQARRVLEAVESVADHPAVMLWAVGNELDWIPPGRPYSPRLWRRLNELAQAIKRVDPRHPVGTVVGTSESGAKLLEIARDGPDIDWLGLNTYGDIAEAAELTRRHWPKPYLFAEWGPTGHWQVPRTPWREPIEETSSEKAAAIYRRYRDVILADRTHCLGSFVFYWAEKQETTHTWYGLWRDGLATESIDVMTFLWTGAWPANRAPAVIDITVNGWGRGDGVTLAPGGAAVGRVACFDPDHDRLEYAWDIRREVEIPPDSYAGGKEEPARPLPGLIDAAEGSLVRFRAPSEPGSYRLFVQVADGQGQAGYANLPFRVAD